MIRNQALPRLQDLSQEQWGLVTRQQIQGAGIGDTTTDRLTAIEGLLTRVGHGVYRVVSAPAPDHQELRAAWLMLAPEIPAWERTPEQGVVSHRSAASMYGIGNLPADIHNFTVGVRKQSRRRDVRIHRRKLAEREWIMLRGLPVTIPQRIASDLLWDNEDPEGVAHIIDQAIKNVFAYSDSFPSALAPHAARFGFRTGDGLALLRALLSSIGNPDWEKWVKEAEDSAHKQVPTEAYAS
jgi:hypothetical protein